MRPCIKAAVRSLHTLVRSQHSAYQRNASCITLVCRMQHAARRSETCMQAAATCMRPYAGCSRNHIGLKPTGNMTISTVIFDHRTFSWILVLEMTSLRILEVNQIPSSHWIYWNNYIIIHTLYKIVYENVIVVIQYLQDKNWLSSV